MWYWYWWGCSNGGDDGIVVVVMGVIALVRMENVIVLGVLKCLLGGKKLYW